MSPVFKVEVTVGEAEGVRMSPKILSYLTSSDYLGNNNRFKSLEECDDTCVETEFKLMHTNKCEQTIEAGPWYVPYLWQ